MKTTKTAAKLEITIRRPNGDIEKKFHPTLHIINDVQFEQIKKGTKDAGRGEVLGYETVEIEVEMDLEEQRLVAVIEINYRIELQRQAKERDHQNDIGFHQSPKFDKVIDELRSELREFDNNHPEIFSQINKIEDEEAARNIESALNA